MNFIEEQEIIKKIRDRVSGRVRAIISANNIKIYGAHDKDSLLKTLGIESFEKYFEYLDTFIDGEEITWDEFRIGNVVIDHIIPVAIYNMRKMINLDLCLNYKNTRLVTRKENFTKNRKVDADLIVKYNIQHLLPIGYKLNQGKQERTLRKEQEWLTVIHDKRNPKSAKDHEALIDIYEYIDNLDNYSNEEDAKIKDRMKTVFNFILNKHNIDIEKIV